MNDSPRPSQKRFEFEGRLLTPIGLIVASVFLLALFGYIGYSRFGLSAGFCLSMLITFSILAFVFYFRAGQMSSDLEIDDNGISRFLFSIKWRQLAWNEIKQIRLVRQNAPDSYKLTWFVFVFSYDRDKGWNPFRPAVVFTERTSDREELSKMLNRYITQYGISVFERRKAEGGKRRLVPVDSVSFNK